MKTRLTPFSKLLIVALVIGGIFAVINYVPGLKEKLMPEPEKQQVENTEEDNTSTSGR